MGKIVMRGISSWNGQVQKELTNVTAAADADTVLMDVWQLQIFLLALPDLHFCLCGGFLQNFRSNDRSYDMER